MFSFGTISHPASLVTEGAPRAKGRRHDTAFHPDRRATSMESSNAWPMSGVEVARAVTKDRAEREEVSAAIPETEFAASAAADDITKTHRPI